MAVENYGILLIAMSSLAMRSLRAKGDKDGSVASSHDRVPVLPGDDQRKIEKVPVLWGDYRSSDAGDRAAEEPEWTPSVYERWRRGSSGFGVWCRPRPQVSPLVPHHTDPDHRGRLASRLHSDLRVPEPPLLLLARVLPEDRSALVLLVVGDRCQHRSQLHPTFICVRQAAD